MPKSIKSRERHVDELPELDAAFEPTADLPQEEIDSANAAQRERNIELERQRFAAESEAIVFLGPDDAMMVDGKTLKHHDVVRVWPHDARAKCQSELFREATAEEAEANAAKCCPGCASGGKCLAPQLGEEG
jgi:hypothetical protein